MSAPDRRKRSRSERIRDSLVWGVLLGASSGAVLGAAIDGVGAALGAVIGAVLFAPAEVITTMRQGVSLQVEMRSSWGVSVLMMSPARFMSITFATSSTQVLRATS